MGLLDFLSGKKMGEQPKQELRHANAIQTPVPLSARGDMEVYDWLQDGTKYVSWWDETGPNLQPLADFYCPFCGGYFLPHEH